MSFLPILPAWIFWPLAALLLGAAVVLVLRGTVLRGTVLSGTVKKGTVSAAARTARWRFAALVLLVVIAAARPSVVGGNDPVATTELNVFFVVDTSPSSAAEDYDGNQTRITGMKSDINAIGAELAGARFSLISFDNVAKTVLPLTTDATALRTMTAVLSARSVYASKGSSVSSAKGELAARLAAAEKTHPERPRLVFYLGDGEQTSAQAPEPFAAGTGLIDGGAVLGYGTSTGGKMRENGFDPERPGPYIMDKSTDIYRPAVSVLDEVSLQAIATQLGVPYLHRENASDLSAVMKDASPRAATTVDGAAGDNVGAGRLEGYWVFAMAAFGMALWELVIYGRAYSEIRRKQGQPRWQRARRP